MIVANKLRHITKETKYFIITNRFINYEEMS